MKALYSLKEKLCAELEEIDRKPELSAGDLETIHKLTDTIKNIDKICILEEEGEYSQACDWEAYGRGNSYSNRGKHLVRGHYSRDGGDGRGDMGVSNRRYSRDGGYSMNDGKERMIEHLEMAMDEATNEKAREEIRRMISKIRDN